MNTQTFGCIWRIFFSFKIQGHSDTLQNWMNLDNIMLSKRNRGEQTLCDSVCLRHSQAQTVEWLLPGIQGRRDGKPVFDRKHKKDAEQCECQMKRTLRLRRQLVSCGFAIIQKLDENNRLTNSDVKPRTVKYLEKKQETNL